MGIFTDFGDHVIWHCGNGSSNAVPASERGDKQSGGHIRAGAPTAAPQSWRDCAAACHACTAAAAAASVLTANAAKSAIASKPFLPSLQLADEGIVEAGRVRPLCGAARQRQAGHAEQPEGAGVDL